MIKESEEAIDRLGVIDISDVRLKHSHARPCILSQEPSPINTCTLSPTSSTSHGAPCTQRNSPSVIHSQPPPPPTRRITPAQGAAESASASVMTWVRRSQPGVLTVPYVAVASSRLEEMSYEQLQRAYQSMTTTIGFNGVERGGHCFGTTVQCKCLYYFRMRIDTCTLTCSVCMY